RRSWPRRGLRSETKASYNGAVGFTNSAHGVPPTTWRPADRSSAARGGGGPSGTADDEAAPSAGLVTEARGMPQQEPRHGEPLGPGDWFKAIPFEPAAWSDRLGWVGLEAVCCRTEPAFELDQPALTHHWLALFVRPPQELDLRYEGVRRHRPPLAGSIML